MSILKNINYIKQLNAIPCGQPDPLIWIETAFSAVAPALLTLYQPGCNEIVKTRLGLSPWHLRGMKSLIKGITGPVEISANKFLYKVGYFTAERFLWYYLIAEVLTAFEASWTSQIYQAQGCQLPGAGTAYGYVAPFIYSPGMTTGLGITPIKNIPGMAVSLSGVTIFPGFEAGVSFDASWDSYPERGRGVNVTTWMQEEDDILHQDEMSTNRPYSKYPNQTAAAFTVPRVGGLTGKRYTFWVTNTGDTLAQAVAGSYNVNLRGLRDGNINFGCKLKPVEWPFPNPLI